MDERMTTFSSAARRVAYTYIRSLAPYTPGSDPAQDDLYAFFTAFYQALYDSPESFGLPVGPDACITGEEQDTKKLKTEIKLKLDKIRARITEGLDFLILAGVAGRLDGQSLLITGADFAAFLGKSRSKKQFLKGLEQLGLAAVEAGGAVTLSSAAYPAMLPALQALAAACVQHPNSRIGKTNFARCDFRSLRGPDYQPPALDLYRTFSAADYQRIALLHEFFTGLGYKPVYQFYDSLGFEVQYQGRRQVKSSPFLRIYYDDRRVNPLSIDLKFASTARLIPLIYQQPRWIQEDFCRRAMPCFDCHWCDTRKALGPSIFELDGQQHKICWYMGSSIPVLDDASLNLIQQYTLIHEHLAPLESV